MNNAKNNMLENNIVNDFIQGISKQRGQYEKLRNVLKKHGMGEAIFIDSLDSVKEKAEVSKEDLLSGETGAITFIIGSYIVRSSQKVFRIIDSDGNTKKEEPASDKDVEYIKNNISSIMPVWRDDLRIVNEISAKNKDSTNNTWVTVCQVLMSKDYRWSEEVIGVYAVKESRHISDKRASLLVLTHYEGNSLGVDTWHRLDPDGKITKLTLHPYNSNIENARFM